MKALFAVVLASAAVLWTGTAAAEDIAAGRYECWQADNARMLFNFEAIGPGRYRDGEGVTGRYSRNGTELRFTGGVHNGRIAYYDDGPPPRVGFRTDDGGIVFTCNLVR